MDMGKELLIGGVKNIQLNAEVFVNNVSIGKHYCGVTPFQFDITDFVNFDRENTLRLYVVNSDIHYIRKPLDEIFSCSLILYEADFRIPFDEP